MEEQGVRARATEGGCQPSEGIIFHREDIDIGISLDGIQRSGIGAADLLSEFLSMRLRTTKNLNKFMVGIF